MQHHTILPIALLSVTFAASSYAALSNVSVSPSSGSGPETTFSATFSDSSGYTDIAATRLLIGSSDSESNSCFLSYDRFENQGWLWVNSTRTWLGPMHFGGPGSLIGEYCTLHSQGSSSSGSGSTLTVQFSVTFNPATFSGNKNVYMYMWNYAVQTTGDSQLGSWTVTPVNALLTNTTRTGATNFVIGDSFQVNVSGGAPYAGVTTDLTKDGVFWAHQSNGTTDGNGAFQLNGSILSNTAGSWTEVWSVGGVPGPTLSFFVVESLPTVSLTNVSRGGTTHYSGDSWRIDISGSGVPSGVEVDMCTAGDCAQMGYTPSGLSFSGTFDVVDSDTNVTQQWSVGGLSLSSLSFTIHPRPPACVIQVDPPGTLNMTSYDYYSFFNNQLAYSIGSGPSSRLGSTSSAFCDLSVSSNNDGLFQAQTTSLSTTEKQVTYSYSAGMTRQGPDWYNLSPYTFCEPPGYFFIASQFSSQNSISQDTTTTYSFADLTTYTCWLF